MLAAVGMELAADYARRLHELLGPELVQVSLFGSRARAQHRPDSDFDLLIVLREGGGDARAVVHRLALEIELEHAIDLSTKVLRAADFQKLSASGYPFWRRFRRDQRLLWPPTTCTNG